MAVLQARTCARQLLLTRTVALGAKTALCHGTKARANSWPVFLSEQLLRRLATRRSSQPFARYKATSSRCGRPPQHEKPRHRARGPATGQTHETPLSCAPVCVEGSRHRPAGSRRRRFRQAAIAGQKNNVASSGSKPQALTRRRWLRLSAFGFAWRVPRPLIS